MRSLRSWTGVGAAIGVTLALVPVVRGHIDVVDIKEPLAKLRSVRPAPPAPSFEGLNLLSLDIRPSRVTAPLAKGRTAELTLDPVVQRMVRAEMRNYRIPEAGVVMIEVKTGKVIAYASHVNQGEAFDVNARAEAPAASVFKVVTGAALVEKAGLNAESEQCYHGGKSRISPDELVDDPRRDKWCATLAIAMGRSLNVVFGRLAQKHLTPEDLTATAGAFGFGAPVPFPVANQAPKVELPEEPVEFARGAAGFWHTTLSPLAGASLAQMVANGGVALEPRIVSSIHENRDQIWKDDAPPRVLRRAIKPETAAQLTRMMKQTVTNGSAHKSFYDEKGKPYLGDITVAGKTGTLSDEKLNRYYTWFVGYAPAESPEIAVSALVVNTPTWHIKGPQLARAALQAYFERKAQKK
jgi:peptidoglycan glycosyltransferase